MAHKTIALTTELKEPDTLSSKWRHYGKSCPQGHGQAADAGRCRRKESMADRQGPGSGSETYVEAQADMHPRFFGFDSRGQGRTSELQQQNPRFLSWRSRSGGRLARCFQEPKLKVARLFLQSTSLRSVVGEGCKPGDASKCQLWGSNPRAVTCSGSYVHPLNRSSKLTHNSCW